MHLNLKIIIRTPLTFFCFTFYISWELDFELKSPQFMKNNILFFLDFYTKNKQPYK